MAVHFYNNDVTLKLSNRTILKRFLIYVALIEGYELRALTYVFCDDDYLLDINRKFLNHDTLTDVITFPLSVDERVIEGEIYISLERVKENAVIYKCSEHDELLRVVFHGLLHLCGYGDKTKKEKLLMREREGHYLQEYNA